MDTLALAAGPRHYNYSQYHDCDARKDQRATAASGNLRMFHHKRNQRSEKRTEADHDGVAQRHPQTCNR
jgi:hypothetical protein